MSCTVLWHIFSSYSSPVWHYTWTAPIKTKLSMLSKWSKPKKKWKPHHKQPCIVWCCYLFWLCLVCFHVETMIEAVQTHMTGLDTTLTLIRSRCNLPLSVCFFFCTNGWCGGSQATQRGRHTTTSSARTLSGISQLPLRIKFTFSPAVSLSLSPSKSRDHRWLFSNNSWMRVCTYPWSKEVPSKKNPAAAVSLVCCCISITGNIVSVVVAIIAAVQPPGPRVYPLGVT